MASPIFRLPPWQINSILNAQDLTEQTDWGLTAYGVPEAWKLTRGAGVRVAILDTGIDTGHSDLIGQLAVDPRDFTGSPSGSHDNQGHGCIAPSDLVYTSLCGLQPIATMFERSPGVVHMLPDGSIIKDLSRHSINTLSLSKENKTVRGRIVAVHKLPYDGELIRVSTKQGDLSLTPWHPVYVQTSARGTEKTVKRKRADELLAGDKICIADRSPGVTDSVLEMPYRTFWKCRFCGHEAAGGNRKQCRKCDKCSWHEGPETTNIKLDEDLAYFVGLVLTDGHLMKRQKSVEFFNNDRRLSNVFFSLCSKLFETTPREYADSRSPMIRLRANSNLAYDLLNRLGIPIGNKSRTVRLPELIAKSPRRIIAAFLAGCIEGDGNIAKVTGKQRLATGSREFANDVMWICRTLGIRSSVQEVKPSATGVPTTKNSYSVSIGNDDEIAAQLRVKRAIRKPETLRSASVITAITKSRYRGPLYDFTIEDHHNYVANGHIVSNTHCAGVVAARKDGRGVIGLAYEAKLIIGKVLGDDGSGQGANVAAGVRWAVQNGAHIISMSLGAPVNDPSIASAIRDAVQSGVFVICAAGNSGPFNPVDIDYPGRMPEAVAVASINKAGKISDFSSRGPSVAIAAPGEQVLSTIPGNRWARMSGTSMATPFVAGVVALAVSRQMELGAMAPKPMKTRADLLEHLKAHAIDAGAPGFDTAAGWGVVNVDKLIEAEQPAAPVQPPPTEGEEFDFGGLKIHIPARAGDTVSLTFSK